MKILYRNNTSGDKNVEFVIGDLNNNESLIDFLDNVAQWFGRRTFLQGVLSYD